MSYQRPKGTNDILPGESENRGMSYGLKIELIFLARKINTLI